MSNPVALRAIAITLSLVQCIDVELFIQLCSLFSMRFQLVRYLVELMSMDRWRIHVMQEDKSLIERTPIDLATSGIRIDPDGTKTRHLRDGRELPYNDEEHFFVQS